MNTALPLLDDVLESFMLDCSEPNALKRYVALYPDYALALVDLAHNIAGPTSDEPMPLDAAERSILDDAVASAASSWPAEAAGTRDLFVMLGPADYGRVSAELGVPRQVVAAVRNRRAIPDTIPRGFLRRMATALGGTIDDLLASIGAAPVAAASYKAVEQPAAAAAVTFEQILIDARVSPERRAEIMADQG